MAYYERRRGGRRQLVFQGPLFQRMAVPAGAALAVVAPALRVAVEFWGDAGYPRVLLVIATTLGLSALAAALVLVLDPTISVIDEDGIRLARPLGSRSVPWEKVAALVVLPVKHMGSQRLFGHRVALLVCGRVLPMIIPGTEHRKASGARWMAREIARYAPEVPVVRGGPTTGTLWAYDPRSHACEQDGTVARGGPVTPGRDRSASPSRSEGPLA